MPCDFHALHLSSYVDGTQSTRRIQNNTHSYRVGTDSDNFLTYLSAARCPQQILRTTRNMLSQGYNICERKRGMELLESGKMLLYVFEVPVAYVI
jgi:hypothetical protein